LAKTRLPLCVYNSGSPALSVMGSLWTVKGH
jgi:hypothetical protein